MRRAEWEAAWPELYFNKGNLCSFFLKNDFGHPGNTCCRCDTCAHVGSLCLLSLGPDLNKDVDGREV